MKTENTFPPPTLERVSDILLSCDQIPLLNISPAFPVDELSEKLSKLFEGKEVKIVLKTLRWKTKEEIFHAIGENINATTILLSPLEGEALLMMSEADIHKMITCLLFKNGETKGFLSNVLEEGYFRYLLLETLHLLSKSPLFSSVSLKLSDREEPTDSAYLVQDMQIKIDGHASTARLALSATLQKSWQHHFANRPSLFEEKIASSLPLSLSVHMGSVSLSPTQLEHMHVGDFLLPDSLSYQPRKEAFSVSLSLKATPLFAAVVEEEKIKIVKLASIVEEPPMEKTEVAIKDLPINVVIEMGQIPLTLEKLTKLSVGNFLEMPTFDQKVSLVANGKKIALGELVYLGDVLGVRITEICS